LKLLRGWCAPRTVLGAQAECAVENGNMLLVPWLSQLTLESPLVAVVAALRAAYLNDMLTYGLQPEEDQLEAYRNAFRAVAGYVVSLWGSVSARVTDVVLKAAIEEEVSKIYRRHGGCRL
jgi:hypothetical protein